MDDKKHLTEIFEASLEDVIAAAGFSSEDVSDDRVMTAVAGANW